MELTFPEFPAEPGLQAAYVAALFLIVYGLALLVFPVSVGQLFGFAERDNRPGALGELRASGGLLSGFSLGVWIMSQPIPYVVLGVAVALAAFGRLVSLLSDKSFSFLNLIVLAAQLVVSVLLLSGSGSAFDGAGMFRMPADPALFSVFVVSVAFAGLGAVLMFAPGLSIRLAGLTAEKSQAFAFVRSAGGFLLAVGAFSAYLHGMADSLWIAPLLIALSILFGIAFSALGRVVALLLNRGNLIYNLVLIVVLSIAAGIILWSIMGAL